MPAKDIAEKHFTEHNDIFCDLINMAFYAGEAVIKPDELQDRPQRELIEKESTLGELERDVCKIYKKAQIELAILGLENQTQPDKYMPIRALEYNAASYRAQREEILSQRRENIVPVITLVVYFGLTSWENNLSLKELVTLPDGMEPYFNDYKINLLPLAFLSEEQIAKFKTVDMQEVAGYLRQRRLHEDYQPTKENMQHVYDVVRVISALSGDKNFITVYNTLISEGKKEVTMCEMIQKIKDDSKQEGKLEGKLEAASNMLKDGLKLETIIKYTGLSLAEIKAITL